MNYDNDLDDSDQREREISLGTTTILGIFLALALICAAFFGFGYSLGRRSAQPNPANAPASKAESTPDSAFSNFKSAPAPSSTAVSDTPAPTASDSDAQPTASSTSDEQPASKEEVALPQPAKPAIRAAQPVAFPPPSAAPATSAGGPVVQISATSRRGDADALIAALKRKGYDASIRQAPQDSLFHVQIGPFPSKKEADAMRQRLDGDGYKAIVK
ncbi:SPOR domain-containing protein [Granulicella arctica]|uniref:Cell division septation protein DedD n=1 Tax=Granulicella arctica TaxID=940613 RepID=A0A7Y9PK17_9BACT|nr:SPOR domain-containing protein [Granulicella arctica]NYF81334.1 cell division septation protein DedD [Granulicella arctica]